MRSQMCLKWPPPPQRTRSSEVNGGDLLWLLSGPPTTHSGHAADWQPVLDYQCGSEWVFSEPFTSRCRLDHCRVKSLYAPWATITSPPVDLKPEARCKLSKCAMRPSRLRPPQNPNVLGELELLLQLCDDGLSNGAISSPMARRCASDWQPPASRKQAAIFFCWRRSSGKSWPRGRSHERISFGSECQRLSFKSAATSPSPTILSTAGSASLARHRFYRRKAVQSAPHRPLTT